ncbi:hypothetical protein RV134_390168 [Roseovarius sp. EC-HK134]|nr:hypothetical protein RV134_390168 [Roseovarius sp. EC-HK134]VVT33744.1 hypothetical protein RV420_470048 [Roseovarius sp. EC-SD190]
MGTPLASALHRPFLLTEIVKYNNYLHVSTGLLAVSVRQLIYVKLVTNKKAIDAFLFVNHKTLEFLSS